MIGSRKRKFSSKERRNQCLDMIKNGLCNLGTFLDCELDEMFIIESIRSRGYNLEFVQDVYGDDRDVALDAINQWGYAFKFLSHRLKNDKELGMIAIQCDPLLIRIAGKDVRGDKEIVLMAIKKNPDVFKYARVELQLNREFILDCVKTNGKIFKVISNKMKSDKDILLGAIKTYSDALIYAPVSFVNDTEVRDATIQNNPSLDVLNHIREHLNLSDHD